MIRNKKKVMLNIFIDWLIRMAGYAVILYLTSLIFRETFQISTSYYGLWILLAAIIINILNKTIKPIIFWVTLPITAITLGIFYPIINIIILKLTSLILGPYFNIEGFLMVFLIALFISLMNIIMDRAVINPITRKVK